MRTTILTPEKSKSNTIQAHDRAPSKDAAPCDLCGGYAARVGCYCCRCAGWGWITKRKGA
jgi:hypothetical protein